MRRDAAETGAGRRRYLGDGMATVKTAVLLWTDTVGVTWLGSTSATQTPSSSSTLSSNCEDSGTGTALIVIGASEVEAAQGEIQDDLAEGPIPDGTSFFAYWPPWKTRTEASYE